MDHLGSVTRGDSEIVELEVFESDGTTRRDITNDFIRFTAKESIYDSDFVFQKTTADGIREVDALQGEIEVDVDTDDLLALKRPEVLYCDCEVTDLQGRVWSKTYTLDFELDMST